MLPLVTRPSIDFIVEEFVASGITEILFITSRRKKSLEDYFDREMRAGERSSAPPVTRRSSP